MTKMTVARTIVLPTCLATAWKQTNPSSIRHKKIAPYYTLKTNAPLKTSTLSPNQFQNFFQYTQILFLSFH